MVSQSVSAGVLIGPAPKWPDLGTEFVGFDPYINFLKVVKIDQRRDRGGCKLVPSPPPFGIYR
jgi:hypothetical protein